MPLLTTWATARGIAVVYAAGSQYTAVAEHAITYRRIRVRAIHASIPPGGKIPEGKWIRRRDLDRYPVTTATRKILAGLEEQRFGGTAQRPAGPEAGGSIREGRS